MDEWMIIIPLACIVVSSNFYHVIKFAHKICNTLDKITKYTLKQIIITYAVCYIKWMKDVFTLAK